MDASKHVCCIHSHIQCAQMPLHFLSHRDCKRNIRTKTCTAKHMCHSSRYKTRITKTRAKFKYIQNRCYSEMKSSSFFMWNMPKKKVPHRYCRASCQAGRVPGEPLGFPRRPLVYCMALFSLSLLSCVLSLSLLRGAFGKSSCPSCCLLRCRPSNQSA